MGLLDGKKALIFGVANDHSIAWGIARAFHDQGATVGFSSIESLLERRVRPLADSIGATFVEPCDVQDDAQVVLRLSAPLDLSELSTLLVNRGIGIRHLVREEPTLEQVFMTLTKGLVQ